MNQNTLELTIEDIKETIEGNKSYFLKTHKIQENIDLSVKYKNNWKLFLNQLTKIYEELSEEILQHDFVSKDEYQKLMLSKFNQSYFIEQMKKYDFEKEMNDWLKI